MAETGAPADVVEEVPLTAPVADVVGEEVADVGAGDAGAPVAETLGVGVGGTATLGAASLVTAAPGSPLREPPADELVAGRGEVDGGGTATAVLVGTCVSGSVGTGVAVARGRVGAAGGVVPDVEVGAVLAAGAEGGAWGVLFAVGAGGVVGMSCLWGSTDGSGCGLFVTLVPTEAPPGRTSTRTTPSIVGGMKIRISPAESPEAEVSVAVGLSVGKGV